MLLDEFLELSFTLAFTPESMFGKPLLESQQAPLLNKFLFGLGVIFLLEKVQLYIGLKVLLPEIERDLKFVLCACPAVRNFHSQSPPEDPDYQIAVA